VATEPTASRREPTSRREQSLRPVRLPGRPRTATVLRAAVVAALLTVAAGVLYSQEPPSCPSAPAAAGVTAAGPTSAAPARPLPIPKGLVGVPVRLAEPAALAAVRPGGRVDLLAVPAPASRGASGQPGVVAPSALVLDVLDVESDAAALLLALDPAQARRTVALPDTTRFAVILR
jgi:hypothetical protein